MYEVSRLRAMIPSPNTLITRGFVEVGLVDL
jgi:hypothetical protein